MTTGMYYELPMDIAQANIRTLGVMHGANKHAWLDTATMYSLITKNYHIGIRLIISKLYMSQIYHDGFDTD